MPRTSQPGRSVSSRLLDVLVVFRPGGSRLTLADLTRETGLPHATVRRLALELVESGALERAPDGQFTVGIRLWQLGTLAPLSLPLRTVALPFMDDLHTALRQHVQLAVLEGTEAVATVRTASSSARWSSTSAWVTSRLLPSPAPRRRPTPALPGCRRSGVIGPPGTGSRQQAQPSPRPIA
jgi:DNA-binding IclR family transcriptional regulator